MLTFIMTMVHVVVCIFLILVVLLQTGKGSDIAAAFGGSSQTAFGARGATTFLSKMTTGAAVVFMITSMTLALFASSAATSVLESDPAAAQGSTATPAGSATPGQTPEAAPVQGDAATPAEDGSAPDEMPQAGSGAPDGDANTP